MKKYEYKTTKGFLRGIKITTEEHVRTDNWEVTWLDSEFIELLLHLDEVWKTPRRLMKHMSINKSSSEIKAFLKYLLEEGFIEKRKMAHKHVEYRRVFQNPTHYGGDV
jgi:predicted transcriptional regulator